MKDKMHHPVHPFRLYSSAIIYSLATVILTACGGGSGSATPSGNVAAPTAAQNNTSTLPGTPAQTLATVRGSVGPLNGGLASWNVEAPLSVVMNDAQGQVIASPTCQSADEVKATVSSDCTKVTAKRVGSFDIIVKGKDTSATLTLQGGPQRSWNGQRGSGKSDGGDDSFTVLNDGTVLAWGSNTNGVLGQNARSDTLVDLDIPKRVLGPNGKEALSSIAQATAGYESVLAVSEDGKVWGWGQGNTYQFGKTTFSGGAKLLPVRVGNELDSGDLDHVVQVEMGRDNEVALRDDGTVLSWGYYHGQGDLVLKTRPGFVRTPDGSANLANIVQIGAGFAYSTALSSDGHVYAWGFDLSSGVLGTGRTYDNPQPLPFVVKKQDGSDLRGIVSISSGYNFTVALAADGSVWVWGDNAFGQLGQDSRSNGVPYAVQVRAPAGKVGMLGDVVMVIAGGRHAVALDRNGNVWAWGSNMESQVGDGPNKVAGDYSLLPRAVMNEAANGPLTGIVSVAATFKTSLAMKADGTILAWGDNSSQELGRGKNSTASPRLPAPVRNGSDDGSLSLPLASYPNITRRAR